MASHREQHLREQPQAEFSPAMPDLQWQDQLQAQYLGCLVMPPPLEACPCRHQEWMQSTLKPACPCRVTTQADLPEALLAEFSVISPAPVDLQWAA